MKTFITYFLLIMSSLSLDFFNVLLAQQAKLPNELPNEEELAYYQLKGKVATLRYHYEPNKPNDSIIQELFFNEQGKLISLVSKEIKATNHEPKIINTIQYEYSKEQVPRLLNIVSSPTTKKTYHYNDTNQTITIITPNRVVSEFYSQPYNRSVYTMNDKKQVISWVQYMSETENSPFIKVLFEYTTAGKLDKTIQYSHKEKEADKIYSYTVYEYNDAQQLVKIKQREGETDIYIATTEYIYTKEGLLERTNFYKHPILSSFEQYTYNPDKTLQKVETGSFTLSYKYDNFQNWIEQKIEYPDSKKVSIQRRSIEYYK